MVRELEITPSASSQERAAIAAALDVVLTAENEARVPGRWWEAGLGASLDENGAEPETPWSVREPGQATARRPRRRFGATRA
jgi:hypothetical protein